MNKGVYDERHSNDCVAQIKSLRIFCFRHNTDDNSWHYCCSCFNHRDSWIRLLQKVSKSCMALHIQEDIPYVSRCKYKHTISYLF